MKYQDLIGQINADINTNGNRAITGAKMNSVLNEMVSVLGDGFRISGEITPQSEAPTDPENGMCYIAATSGSYVNFGNIGVNDDEIAFIYYDSDNESWNKMRWSRKDFGLVVVDVSTLNSFGEDEMNEVRKPVCFIIRNDAEGVGDRLFVKDRGQNGFVWFYAAPMLISDLDGDLVLEQGCIQIRSTAEGGRYPYETVSIGYKVPTKGNVAHALSLKADKVSDATQGNLAALDSSGNLTDSGISSNNIVQKSQTSGLLKNDGTVDTTQYGTYSKPSGGIPAADLASGVIPTVPTISTDIKNDATSDTKTASPKAVKDYVDGAVPAISTDITADATSDIKTASPKAVKTFVEGKGYGSYSKPAGGIPETDLATAVQTSLGLADSAVQTETDPVFSASAAAGITSSDISDWDGKAEPTPVVDASSQAPSTMEPNTVYRYGTLSGNTTFPAFATPASNTVANVWCWTFTTPSTAPTITWPAGITAWAGGSAPTINASKSYEVSVMDGLALIVES